MSESLQADRPAAAKLTVREAAAWERRGLCPSADGVFVVESGGFVQAYGCYTVTGGVFIAHDGASLTGDPTAFALIFQALRRKAKGMGYAAIRIAIDPPHGDLLRLVESGKADIERIWIKVKVGP